MILMGGTIALALFFWPSFALIWADREVKALSCDEGAAPQSVVINHQAVRLHPGLTQTNQRESPHLQEQYPETFYLLQKNMSSAPMGLI